jgi:NTE family protein
MFRRLLAIGLLAVAATSLFAQQPAPNPPRVALVLGGGGARGGAHLGVLEVLEELRIPIACIAGTSMGALVGGAYASGVSPREILDLVGKTDWNAMFDDFAGREAVNIRRKELDDRFYSGLEFGVSTDGIRFRETGTAFEYDNLVDPDVFRFKEQWFMYVFGRAGTLALVEWNY